MATAIQIASLPLGIIGGIYFGRLAYRGDLPLAVVALLVGGNCGAGLFNALFDFGKWLERTVN